MFWLAARGVLASIPDAVCARMQAQPNYSQSEGLSAQQQVFEGGPW
jgi:hypothetical protein